MPTWGTLGPDPFDPETIIDGDFHSVREVLRKLLLWHKAYGSFAPAHRDDDELYQPVVRQDVAGTDVLYATNPDDPMNPIVLAIGAGSATVVWQDEGSTIIASGTANFVGDGVTVTDEGDGKATITIPGGGGGGTTYTAGDGIDLTAFASDEIQVLGYEAIVVDANGVSVDFDPDAGLKLDSSGAAAKLQAHIGLGLQFDGDGAIAIDLVAGDNITIDGNEISATGGGGGSHVAGQYIDIGGTATGSIDVDFGEVPGYFENYLLGAPDTTVADPAPKTGVFGSMQYWLTKLVNYNQSAVQSIGHDAGGLPEWQADGVC